MLVASDFSAPVEIRKSRERPKSRKENKKVERPEKPKGAFKLI